MDDFLQNIFIQNNQLNLHVLKLAATSFVRPCGSVSAFKKSLGIKKNIGELKTPLGNVTIKPHSQYMKMHHAKENRLYLAGNYAKTLKDPLSVVQQENTRHYIGLYWTNKNTPMIHIVIVEKIENRWVVKTNYPRTRECEIRNTIKQGEKVEIYRRSGIDAHLFQDAVMLLSQGAREAEVDAAVSIIIHEYSIKVKQNNLSPDEAVKQALLNTQTFARREIT